MSLELNIKITGAPSSIASLRYTVYDLPANSSDELVTNSTGELSNVVDGVVLIPFASATLGETFGVLLDNYDGSNVATSKSAFGWVEVTDAGADPTLLQPATSTEYPVDVVSLGASILQGSYTVTANIDEFKRTAALGGLNVDNFYNYAIGGYTTSNTLASSLPKLLSERAATAYKTKVLLHTIGNNVSQNGPYPGGADTIETEITSIITQLQDAGFEVLPLLTSYRTPPASNPTDPYNTNILLPIFTQLCPNTIYDNGTSALDFQAFTRDVTAQYQTDGTHYNSTGYFQNASWMGTAAAICVKAGTDETKDPEYVVPSTDPITHLIIDFGNDYTDGVISSVETNGDLDYALDESGKLIHVGVTTVGFGNTTNKQGTARDGVGYVLDNSAVTTDAFFVPSSSFSGWTSGTFGQVNFDGVGIVDTDSYTIVVGGSRGVSDNLRKGDITIGGETLILDSADSALTEYATVTFTGVTGAELRSGGIKIARNDPSNNSTFAYLGGIEITKEG